MIQETRMAKLQCMRAVCFPCTSNSYFKESRKSCFPWHTCGTNCVLDEGISLRWWSIFSLSRCLYHLHTECQPRSFCLITAVKTTQLSHIQQTKKCLELYTENTKYSVTIAVYWENKSFRLKYYCTSCYYRTKHQQMWNFRRQWLTCWNTTSTNLWETNDLSSNCTIH